MIQRSDSKMLSENNSQRGCKPTPAARAADSKERDAQSVNARRRRRLLMEGLEQRQLLAAEVFIPEVDPAIFAPRDPMNIGDVPAFIANEIETDANPATSNGSFNTAQLLPLGTLSGQQSVIDVQGSANVTSSPQGNFTTDVDFYAFDLRAGDILDISVIGSAGPFNVFYDDGGLWFGTNTVRAGGPDNSPLMTVGNASAAQVVPEDGRYFLQIVPASTLGNYTVGLRVHRPIAEQLPIGAQQILYVDFDGGFYPSTLFEPTSTPTLIRLDGLQQSAPLLGLDIRDTAAQNELIDLTLEEIERGLGTVATNGGNGDFNTTGVPGQYAVTVLNSRDHADPGFNNPLVSRIVVGGDVNQAGIDTIGLAQFADIGNFSLSDNAIVLVDQVLAAVSAFEFSNTSSILDGLGRYLGFVVAHEAGHLFGLEHTNGDNFIGSISDEGVGAFSPEVATGVGPDQIFGTVDDRLYGFVTDEFSVVEAELFGFQRSAEAIAHTVVTGTAGGTLTGTVFNDRNRDGSGSGEPGLAGITVFADRDGDGVIDPLEPSAVTDANGVYNLFVGPGSYNVTVVVPNGLAAITPASQTRTVALNQTVSGVSFGLVPLGDSFTGRVFGDTNGDGDLDAGEPAFEGIYVYADLDGDNRPDLGEPGDFSAADGTYKLQFPGPGTYTVRVVPTPGLELTLPQSGEYQVTSDGLVTDGSNFNFGFRQSLDFSDAPASYGSASHAIVNGLSLGTLIDRDFGPFFTAAADGDDLDGADDEDGVTLNTAISVGNPASISVDVTNTTGSPGYLHGWVDLDRDGVFAASEKIIDGIALADGDHVLSFDVPATASLGDSFARFRYSHQPTLAATGPSTSGEVEDYRFTIIQTSGNAGDDTFNVPRNSNAFPLDVLANDFESTANPLQIVNVDRSGVQGTIVIAGDGRSLFYSPPGGFLGLETFTYTTRDAFGNENTASVTVNVTFQSPVPIAVDDTFEIPQNSSDRPLNVLANDLASTAGGLTITGATQGSEGGIVSVVSGGLSIRYTPQPGFAGTEEFEYTVQDPDGQLSTATVTVNSLPGSQTDDIVDFTLRAFGLNGDPLTDIPVGEEFNLTVFVEDLRAPAFGDPEGLASAFLDVLYNDQLVSVVESAGITYGRPIFSNPGGTGSFTQGDFDTPGLMNEIGAVQANFAAPTQHDTAVPLFTVRLQALAAGVAEFTANPADQVTSETTLVFSDVALTPAQQRLGSTSVNIVSGGQSFAAAIDDAFLISVDESGQQVIATDSLGNPITVGTGAKRFNVLANDQFGPTGLLQEFTIEVSPGQGTATINDNGTPDLRSDDFIEYTPFGGASGADSFVYGFVAGDGVRSTARVNLTIGNVNPGSLLVGMDFDFVDEFGDPIASAAVGDVIGLRVDVDDLRVAFGDETMVFSAFLDILYDTDLLAPATDPADFVGVSGIDFGLGFAVRYGEFMDADSGTGFIGRPGIVDEFGTNDLRGTIMQSDRLDPRQLATLYFKATGDGTANFVGSPADSFPFSETLLLERDQPVPVDQILFDTASIVIGIGEGESPRQNSALPVDVNDDGHVTSIDALLIINELNRNPQGFGEGESAGLASRFFTDVTGDNEITALDALQVINYLNRMSRPSVSAGGEGEAAPLATDTAPLLATDTAPAVAQASAEVNDSVFSDLGTPTKIVGENGQAITPQAVPQFAASTTPAEDEDDDFVLTLLADDVNRL